MRWGLGFFRLWVVLSIGWVLFVSAFFASDFPNESQPWRHVYTESGLDAGTISEVEKMVERARAAGDSDAVATFMRQLDLAKERLASAQREILFLWAAISFFVPLTLLVIGLAVRWIARGFKAD